LYYYYLEHGITNEKAHLLLLGGEFNDNNDDHDNIVLDRVSDVISSVKAVYEYRYELPSNHSIVLSTTLL
jgi:hypothetical protein